MPEIFLKTIKLSNSVEIFDRMATLPRLKEILVENVTGPNGEMTISDLKLTNEKGEHFSIHPSDFDLLIYAASKAKYHDGKKEENKWGQSFDKMHSGLFHTLHKYPFVILILSLLLLALMRYVMHNQEKSQTTQDKKNSSVDCGINKITKTCLFIVAPIDNNGQHTTSYNNNISNQIFLKTFFGKEESKNTKENDIPRNIQPECNNEVKIPIAFNQKSRKKVFRNNKKGHDKKTEIDKIS